jgi:hypothetical protein
VAGKISVVDRDDGSFGVVIEQGSSRSEHVVTVPPALQASLGVDESGRGELVRESFVFLLAREPPSSILRSFSLDVISRYFPEYPAEIRRALTRPRDP